MLFVIDFIAR